MRFNYFIILIPFCFCCQKEDFNIQNLNGNKIVIQGHGGMGVGQAYPTNSFESIARCLYSGADGTEIDIQMTRDSVLVAFHNQKLSPATNLKGRIHEHTWEEVKRGYYREAPYLNYRIASLDQIFSNIKAPSQYHFSLDCKLFSYHQEAKIYMNTFSRALERVMKKHNLMTNIYIESSSLPFLKILKKSNANYNLMYYTKSFQQGHDLTLEHRFFGMVINIDDITELQAKLAHENGLYVSVWGIHSNKKNKEAIRKNPDFIQTDKVKSLVKLLK